jgi:NADPH:quinone reductase-like Zn-dependent oxidoreductase
MKAAVLNALHTEPVVQEFDEPREPPDARLIRVIAGAGSPTELMRAAGTYGAFNPPCVVGGEGVGALAGTGRVYFGHSLSPFGAWAQYTVVPQAEIWPIPDELSDGLAIALGASGTGALIPLEEAKIRPGERILILGATGPVGQIALQLARRMGAGKIVAAGRNRAALARLQGNGFADDIAQLGTGDDLAALKAVAGKGYDVVLDAIYGPPAEAALRATAPGARMMSIGVQAGFSMSITLRDLVSRTHVGVGTGMRPVAERRAAFERLVALAREGHLTVDTAEFSLDDAAAAWEAQRRSPHAKIIVRPTF